MKNKNLGIISLSLIGISLALVSIGIIVSQNEIETQALEEKAGIKELGDRIEQQIVTDTLVISPEFTVNMKGNTKHGDVLTISGTVPTPNSSITGMIYHGGENSPTIVTVFQLTSDDIGFYTHNVVVNDEYLWKQEGEYIISIQNEGIYKELQFHRNW